MKKKFGLIAFIAVCTIAITIGIASFTLGMDGSSGTSTNTGNLGGIYNSYVSQIQRIIDNSNLSSEYSSDITHYHIVQIVDSQAVVDEENKKFSEYLTNYINHAEDDQSLTAGNFRTEIIGTAMKAKYIDLQTFSADSEDLAEAIRGADLIYIACNDSYKTSSDMSNDAVLALETYALSEFKPVIVDSDIVGVIENVTNSSSTAKNPKIATYIKKLKGDEQTNNNGTFSFKTSDMTWEQYFDDSYTESTYTLFNNKANYTWNTFDYAGGYQHKVLEIVPDQATKDATTDFEKCVTDGTFAAKAFFNPVSTDNIAYEKVTFTEFVTMVENKFTELKAQYQQQLDDGTITEMPADNKIYQRTMFDYDFIYMNHTSEEKIYVNGTNDFTDNAINALKGFRNKTQADRNPNETYASKVYVNRLMIDNNFISVYKTSATSGSTTTTVDTTTNAYKFITKLISNDGLTAYVKNVEITKKGYFGAMDEDKASAITALINRSTYRNFSAGNGSSFKVLEIQPYYSVTNEDWYNAKQSELTNKLENPVKQEINEVMNNMYKDGALTADTPYYTFTMTQAKIAAATGLNVDQIALTTVSANALNAMSVNLLEDYDLIYIGGVNQSIKDKTEWNSYKILTSSKNKMVSSDYHFISFSPDDINNFYFASTPSSTEKLQYLSNNAYVYPCYTHTGDFSGITDQRNIFTNLVNGDYKQSATRLNGNDITANLYGQLYSFIAAGMPVIVDDNVLDTDYLIGGSSANATLVEDTQYRVKTDSGVTLNRLKLDATVDENADLTFKNKSGSMQTIKYKQTNYSKKTMIARRESTIDPESYVYQLMYQIAENKDSGIYHADNVLVGFDDKDVVSSPNLYRETVTADAEETVPEDIEETDYTEKKPLISELTGEEFEGYDKVSIFNNKVEKTILGEINYAKSGAGIQLKHFLNMHGVNRPSLNLIKAPKDYDSEATKEQNENSHSPTFSFSIDGATGTTYNVKLYYDFDGDGKYRDEQVVSRYNSLEYDTEVVAEINYTAGTDGIVTFSKGANGVKDNFEIPNDFVGLMPYKLVVTDAKGKKTSVIGYPKYYTQENNKQEIRLLQIIPGYENGGLKEISNDVTTLCADENTLSNGQTLSNHEHTFGIVSCNNSNDNLASRLFDEYDIDLTIMTTGQFCEMANCYLADYCKNFAENKVRDGLTEEEIDKFEEFMSKYYNSATGKMKSSWSSVIDWLNTTIYDFYDDLGISDKVFASWLVTGDSSREVTLDTKHADGSEQKFDLGGYNMIIIGFAKEMGGNVYNRADMTNLGCQYIRTFAENYGSIFLGTDTLSFDGFYNTTTMRWGRNINQYLRGCFGMDRFKFTTNGEYSTGSNTEDFYKYINDGNSFDGGGTAYLYKPYTSDTELKSNITGQLMPGEFFTTNSYDGTYEQDSNQNACMAGGGSTDALAYALGSSNTIFKEVSVANIGQGTAMLPTSRIAQNNAGLMTRYPFYISTYPNISTTNSQSFALDLEDEDMTVWYSLAGATNADTSSLYAADALNGRSYYYLYTFRNVTFSGVGYSAIAETANNDDERKLLINAIFNNVAIGAHGPDVEFAAYSGSDNNDDTKFIPKTATSCAILECAKQSQNAVNFDFVITPAKNKKITSAVLFVDADENSDYNGTDSLLKEYDAAYFASKTGSTITVQVSGKDVDTFAQFIQKGKFYISVKVTDSEGKTDVEKMLVSPKSKLFDLH